ncbi:hypothetical protein [Brachybacterium sp. UNK5269]|uniref:hypothetical protein n=1 Tax=Brachybacterium sp. UNK5269 TaxID=3408576 RepID=UPI003BB19776
MAGELMAEIDPGVRPTWDALPPGLRTFVVDMVEALLHGVLVVAIAVLITGAVLWGFGAVSNRPGIGGLGVRILAVATVVAIVCVGSTSLLG